MAGKTYPKWGYAEDGGAEIFEVDAETGALPEGYAETPAFWVEKAAQAAAEALAKADAEAAAQAAAKTKAKG